MVRLKKTHNTKSKCDECGKLRFNDDLINLRITAEGVININLNNNLFKRVCCDGCNFQLECGCWQKMDPGNLQDKYAFLYCYGCNITEKRRLIWHGDSMLKWMKKHSNFYPLQ